MDRGIEAILGELIEMVQATAPAQWAMAQRQVLANTVGNAVWGGLCLLATIALGLVGRYCVQQYQENGYSSGWDLGAISAFSGACVLLIVVLINLNNVIVYYINPDYYAIKVLLGLVR